jgi:hypothetical protein
MKIPIFIKLGQLTKVLLLLKLNKSPLIMLLLKNSQLIWCGLGRMERRATVGCAWLHCGWEWL